MWCAKVFSSFSECNHLKKNKKPSEFVWLLNVDLTSPPVCNLISGVPEQVTSVIYHFVPEQHHNVGRAAFEHLQLGEGKIPQMRWRVELVQYYCFLVTCSFNTPSSRFLQWNTTFPEKEHKNVLWIVGFSLWSRRKSGVVGHRGRTGGR